MTDPIKPATDEEIADRFSYRACDCGADDGVSAFVMHDPPCWMVFAPRIMARIEADRATIADRDAELERLNADYQRIIAEIIPHARPASSRPDDQLEPPWEVVRRLVAEIERLEGLIVRAVKTEEALEHYCNSADAPDDVPGVEADLAEDVDEARRALDTEARAILANRAKEGR